MTARTCLPDTPMLPRLVLLLLFGLLLTACATESRNPPLPESQQSSSGNENKIPEAARTILEHADKFEILSLSPGITAGGKESTFHGYKILGRAVITDTEIQKHLISAFEKGVAENDGT